MKSNKMIVLEERQKAYLEMCKKIDERIEQIEDELNEHALDCMACEEAAPLDEHFVASCEGALDVLKDIYKFANAENNKATFDLVDAIHEQANRETQTKQEAIHKLQSYINSDDDKAFRHGVEWAIEEIEKIEEPQTINITQHQKELLKAKVKEEQGESYKELKAIYSKLEYSGDLYAVAQTNEHLEYSPMSRQGRYKDLSFYIRLTGRKGELNTTYHKDYKTFTLHYNFLDDRCELITRF